MVISAIIFGLLASVLIVTAIITCIRASKIYNKMAKDETKFIHSICETIKEYIGE